MAQRVPELPAYMERILLQSLRNRGWRTAQELYPAGRAIRKRALQKGWVEKGRGSVRHHASRRSRADQKNSDLAPLKQFRRVSALQALTGGFRALCRWSRLVGWGTHRSTSQSKAT